MKGHVERFANNHWVKGAGWGGGPGGERGAL